MEIDTDFTEIKLDIREIKTLLTERSTAVENNTKNVGEAFKEIRRIDADLGRNNVESHRLAERMAFMEQRLEALEKSNTMLSHSIQSLKEAQTRLLVISSLDMAVLTAVVIKFFTS
jgi:chromosome segregation ATPase